MTIVLGSDHGGYEIKEAVRAELASRGFGVVDTGCSDRHSVDYPDYARAVAGRVADGEAGEGVLVCTTGLGMSIMANKFPGVRAALCLSPDMAVKARTHNNANVLVLGGAYLGVQEAVSILDAWLTNRFEGAPRHLRRVRKIDSYAEEAVSSARLRQQDAEVYEAVRCEVERERDTINLIASENYVSAAVSEAQGSVLTNKYAEGYPGRRWYNGCRCADAVERLAIERARGLFCAEHANVQPHGGSAANMAAYFALLEPGDTILSMSLAHGGHLTHGHGLSFSGRLFDIKSYGVSRDSETIDYDEVETLAREHRPRLILAGASAYPRLLDFERFREIADAVGAYLMVDMAHIAGLVAGGAHPNPVPLCDIVSTTTHKTLRGPRSGLLLCRDEHAEKIDRQVFPGIQGGPMMHTIAAKAVCFGEAARPDFADYARQVVRNAAALADALAAKGHRLVSGGTDNHLMLVDLTEKGLTGRDAAAALEKAGIVANKNSIPFDTRNPFLASGIRLGTPAATTRGMRESELRVIGNLIADVLARPEDADVRQRVAGVVQELTQQFPVPA